MADKRTHIIMAGVVCCVVLCCVVLSTMRRMARNTRDILVVGEALLDGPMVEQDAGRKTRDADRNSENE